MRSKSSKVDGFLNLHKPRGLTSMEAVRRVRRFTDQKGVGHGGTLDPLAEGVLPICFGQATRLMEYLVEARKLYHMEIRLGISTDTHDAEGKVTGEGDPSAITPDQVESALSAFRGVFQQLPPMYSALKRDGRRLYHLARAGIEVERKPRTVQVYDLEVLQFQPPRLVMKVECGRGLYIRSLAHDLGQALGCGGHLSALIRLRAGPFQSEEATSLDELEEECRKGMWEELLYPMDFPLLFIRAIRVNRAEERLLRNGQPVPSDPQWYYAAHLENCRAYTDEGRFLGVVRLDKSRGRWRPYKIFRPGSPSIYAPK